MQKNINKYIHKYYQLFIQHKQLAQYTITLAFLHCFVMSTLTTHLSCCVRERHKKTTLFLMHVVISHKRGIFSIYSEICSEFLAFACQFDRAIRSLAPHKKFGPIWVFLCPFQKYGYFRHFGFCHHLRKKLKVSFTFCLIDFYRKTPSNHSNRARIKTFFFWRMVVGA